MPDKSLRFVLLVAGTERSRHKTLSAAKARAKKLRLNDTHNAVIQNVYPKKGEGVRWRLSWDAWVVA